MDNLIFCIVLLFLCFAFYTLAREVKKEEIQDSYNLRATSSAKKTLSQKYPLLAEVYGEDGLTKMKQDMETLKMQGKLASLFKFITLRPSPGQSCDILELIVKQAKTDKLYRLASEEKDSKRKDLMMSEWKGECENVIRSAMACGNENRCFVHYSPINRTEEEEVEALCKESGVRLFLYELNGPQDFFIYYYPERDMYYINSCFRKIIPYSVFVIFIAAYRKTLILKEALP